MTCFCTQSTPKASGLEQQASSLSQFPGPGCRGWFGRMVWLRVLVRSQTRCHPGLPSSEGLTGWTVCFQDGSLTQLLLGGLGSLPRGPLHGAAVAASWLGGWCPPWSVIQKRRQGDTMVLFSTWTWKPHTVSFTSLFIRSEL